MPDGYAFELKIAERMRVLGWVCEMTPASNDFGADLFCRVGDEFIVLQCKCYDDASSIGVAAVQEVCTAARHFDAGLGLVVYEGRPSRSAKSLAQSVGVRLFHADELVAGWEFDRTAKGTALRIEHLEQKEAADAAARMREKAARLEGYRLDLEAYLTRMKGVECKPGHVGEEVELLDGWMGRRCRGSSSLWRTGALFRRTEQ